MNTGKVACLADSLTGIGGELKKLRLATDACIEQLRSAGGIPEEPVCWPEARCIAACFLLDDDSKARFVVIVSDAAPDALRFQLAIRELLEKAGWSHVEVMTEW